ncbi:MAG TPA: hypothetical protein VE422_23880 [Terriglobia bacterium]|nr:hypothetical protein [Terriglobia bacterium]
MPIFLSIVSAGFLALVVLAMVMFLFFPVFGIVLRQSDTALLILAAFSYGSGFLLYALARRQVRLDLELRQPLKDLGSEDVRKQLESRRNARAENFWKRLAAGLMIPGLASAIVMLFTQVNWLPARDTTSMWWLLVTSSLLGGLAAFFRPAGSGRPKRAD